MLRRVASWTSPAVLTLVLAAACGTSDGGAGPTDDAGLGAEGGGLLPDGGVAPPKDCQGPADCPGGVCAPDKKCRDASTADGVKNGQETDIDCGGPAARACDPGKTCAVARDCASVVCKDGTCRAPTHDDGVKNGDETGKDCGGPTAAPCPVGEGCAAPTDCAGRVCTAGVCAKPRDADGQKNGDETDVDCGGPSSPPCADGLTCAVATDCTSSVCAGGTCQAPTPTDGVKNGTETDVDCGGGAPGCAVGKVCAAGADCASQGCAFDGRCAAGRSCTKLNGGRTCGRGEVGDANALHEDCCTEIFVDRPVANGGPFWLDKYLVTAGRLREFITQTGGNVKAAVENDAKWVGGVTAYTQYLPTNEAEALAQLGPYAQAWETGGELSAARGCQTTFGGGGGGRTYYQAPVPGPNGTFDVNEYPQDILDQKIITCITPPMLFAFCVWDGKDLPIGTELTWAWTGGDAANRAYPWGNTPVPPTTPNQFANEHVVHRYNYIYPFAQVKNDATLFIPAPGRKSLGAGPFGHFDLAGSAFEFARTAAGGLQRLNSGSWENHVPAQRGAVGNSTEWARRYYAFGGRCGRR